jgi:hypothetical protein
MAARGAGAAGEQAANCRVFGRGTGGAVWLRATDLNQNRRLKVDAALVIVLTRSPYLEIRSR